MGINIKKYPQYELYLTTLKLNECRDQLKPENCSEYRGIDSTIISRAYYSAYSYAALWLYEKHDFEPEHPKVLKKKGKEPKSEHTQVSDELKKHNNVCATKLVNSKILRQKADYDMLSFLSKKEIEAAISNMKYIINNLHF